MSHGRILLSQSLCLGIFIGFGALATGCAQDPAEQLRERLVLLGDTRLDQALRQNLMATGGLEAWAQPLLIDGQVLATLMGADGGKTLLQQQHIIKPGERVLISVSSKEPDGVLTEWLDHKGKVQTLFKAQGQLDRISLSPDKIDILAAALRLRLLSQAMTGAVGLLQKDFVLRYAGQERQGGRQMHKIEVTGPLLNQKQFDYDQAGNLLVVWIDAETSLLEKLWLRYRMENGRFGYLAVNITDHARTSEGMVLPRLIEFVRSDEYQQFGHLYIMTLEYQKMQVTRQLEK